MPDSPAAPATPQSSSEAMVLGAEYGFVAILRPIETLPLRDSAYRWFGWANVPISTRLRLDNHITRVERTVPSIGLSFENVPDPSEVGYPE